METDCAKILSKNIEGSYRALKDKKKILFLATSNRWFGEEGGEQPKSTRIALFLQEKLGKDIVTLIDITKLKIFPCEGNVSTARGNTCGVAKAALKDKVKNPSGFHRCWASMNNPDDELWKISKALFESEVVVFFGSVRWGQANSFYQKLIERLTWIENRHSAFDEENVVKNIQAGCVFVGQNWHGKEVLETQKEVLNFYGFSVVEELCWNWQYTGDIVDESDDTYKSAFECFAGVLRQLSESGKNL